jgi:hypothetical protein
MPPRPTSNTSKHNWWFDIKGQVTDEDIENIHKALSSNSTIDPTKRYVESNIAKGITFAITVVYYKPIKGDRKGAFMKVSYQKNYLIY